MSVVYPNANGVWSDTTNWYDDATGLPYGMVPQDGDIVALNNCIITLDINTNSLAGLTAEAQTTAINNGYVLISSGGYILDVNYPGSIGIIAYAIYAVLINHTTGGHTEVNAPSAIGGINLYQPGVRVAIGYGNTCELNINMIYVRPTSARSTALTISSDGNVTFTFDEIRPINSAAEAGYYMLLVEGGGEHILNGNIRGKNEITDTLHKSANIRANTILNGNVYGGQFYQNTYVVDFAECLFTINGNIYGENNMAVGLNTNAKLLVTGNVYGSDNNTTPAIRESNTATDKEITVLGTVYAGNKANNTVIVLPSNYSKTTLNNISASSFSPAIVDLTLSASITSELIVKGNLTSVDGIQPIFRQKFIVDSSTAQTSTFQTETPGVNKVLSSALTDVGSPIEADVRKDTVYGSGSQFTGTLAVPTPNQVLIDVPTDNTVGTFTGGGGGSVDYSAIADMVGVIVENNFP